MIVRGEGRSLVLIVSSLAAFWLCSYVLYNGRDVVVLIWATYFDGTRELKIPIEKAAMSGEGRLRRVF